MNSILLAVLLWAPSVPAGDPVPQAEDSLLVSYDLRAALPRWDGGTSWTQSLLSAPFENPHDSKEGLEDSLAYAELTSFELLDLLTQILGDELRREGRELHVEGSRLTVLGPASLQEQVGAILEGLESALGGTVGLRVDMLSLGEGQGELPSAGLLAEQEAGKLVAALIARGAQHRSQLLELSAGRTAYQDARRRIPYLFDYDVEIAQGIMVFAPVMSAVDDGTRVAARGVALPGGLALSTLLLRSELLGEIVTRPVGLTGVLSHAEQGPVEFIDGPDGIQSPEVLVRGLAFDSFLPDGKALVLTVEGALGKARTREVILLRRTGGSLNSYVVRPIPRTNRTLIALESELFRAPRLLNSAAPELDDDGAWQPSASASLDTEVSGFLMEWLKVRFSVWRRFGPWVLIVTDPAWDRDGAAQLDRLVKAVRPATAMNLASVELRAQGREPAVLVRMRVPLLEGSNANLVLARGETAVTGYDVEVAQGAAVPDTRVSTIFEGLALVLAVQGSSLETSGMAQLMDRAVARLEPGYALIGAIERPEPRLLRFDERLRLWAAGAPVRIGSTSDRPEQPGLILEIGVTPLR